MLKTEISLWYFFWEYQEYRNRHPGANFGSSLGGSWESGGARKWLLAHELTVTCTVKTDMTSFTEIGNNDNGLKMM